VAARFSSADPGWVVRPALRYGPEAEILEPFGVREMVVEATSTFLEDE